MKTILLGIYRTETFNHLLQNTSLHTFPFNEMLENWDYGINLGIVDTVAMACSHCDIIHFSLDKIRLPLSRNMGESYTCNELSLILSRKDFYQKTIFYLNKQVLSKEEFQEWLNKV